MKSRLEKFEDVGLDDWKFSSFNRSSAFADAIRPDEVNLIDYLELSGEKTFLVGDEIRAIYDRLGNGLAVIALQKKKGADYGRGAEFSLEKARLYLAMDSGKLKVVKAKEVGSNQTYEVNSVKDKAADAAKLKDLLKRAK